MCVGFNACTLLTLSLNSMKRFQSSSAWPLPADMSPSCLVCLIIFLLQCSCTSFRMHLFTAPYKAIFLFSPVVLLLSINLLSMWVGMSLSFPFLRSSVSSAPQDPFARFLNNTRSHHRSSLYKLSVRDTLEKNNSSTSIVHYLLFIACIPFRFILLRMCWQPFYNTLYSVSSVRESRLNCRTLIPGMRFQR